MGTVWLQVAAVALGGAPGATSPSTVLAGQGERIAACCMTAPCGRGAVTSGHPSIARHPVPTC